MNLRSLSLLPALALAAIVVPLSGACSSSTTETADGGGTDSSATATATATSDAAPSEAGATEATLSSLQASIFTPSCAKARCHLGSRPSAGLNLEAANTHAQLVGIASQQNSGATRVVAGDPAKSLLVQVLKGNVGNVERMPDGAAALSADQIAAVEAWIAAGAKND